MFIFLVLFFSLTNR